MAQMLPGVHIMLPFARDPPEGPAPATLVGNWRGNLTVASSRL